MLLATRIYIKVTTQENSWVWADRIRLQEGKLMHAITHISGGVSGCPPPRTRQPIKSFQIRFLIPGLHIVAPV
jgi:hypothetical protein